MLRRGPSIQGPQPRNSYKQPTKNQQTSFLKTSNSIFHKNYNHHNINVARQKHTVREIEQFLVDKKHVDLEQEETGAFGVKSASSPKEIGRWQLNMRRVYEQAQQRKDDNEDTKSLEASVKELNNMFAALYNARDTLSAIQEFHPDEELAKQANRVHKTLENMINTIVEAQDSYETVKTATEKSIAAAPYLLDEFKRLGAHLPEEKRRNLFTVQDNLRQVQKNLESTLSSDTHYNLKKPSRLSRQEMPMKVYDTIPKYRWKRKRFGEISLTEHAPEIMRVSKHSDLRQQAYDNIVKHLNDEVYPIMDQVLESRAEFARMFGYESWSEMIMDQNASFSTSETRQYLESITSELREPVRSQIVELRQVRSDHQEELDREKATMDRKHKHRPRPRKDPIPDQSQPIEPSERNYYQQVPFRQLRQELREYFSLPSVFQGALNVMEELFAVDIHAAKFRPEETWDILNVRKLNVYDRDSNRFVGTVYLDLFERPSKTYSPYPNITHQYIERSVNYSQDHDSNNNNNNNNNDRTAVLMVGHGFQIPVEHLPSLLETDEACRIFQQIGSAIGSLLWSGSPGFFAREPRANDLQHTLSAVLQSLFYKPSVLDMVGIHYQSHANISVETKFHLSEARSKWAALDLLSDTTVALQDLHLHNATVSDIGDEEEFTNTTLSSVARKHHNLLPLVPDVNRIRRFSGLLPTEMMSRIYAAQITQNISGSSRENLLADVGKRLRGSLYSVGATEEPKNVVKNMLNGENVNEKYLLQEFGII